jgi:general secretion pathway protein D
MEGRPRPASGVALVCAALLAGCAPGAPPERQRSHAEVGAATTAEASTRHITHEVGESGGGDPATVEGEALTDPSPDPSAQARPDAPRVTVAVDGVPAQEVLFALARDADIDIDIAATFDTPITLNAVDEPLPRLLERIAAQVPLRYRFDGDYLRIARDEPFARTYEVPYVDMTRQARSSIDTATQVGSTGFTNEGETGSAAGGGSNSSRTRVTNETGNRFWQSLQRNLAALIGAGDSDAAETGDARRYVMLNRDAGYVTVRATQDEHRATQRYLERVVASARRQVLIEATVVEVRLDERHQAGVDWSLIANEASGLDLVQNLTGGDLGGVFETPSPSQPGEPAATIGYQDPDTGDGGLQSTIKLLERFGEVSVVSSPKISALNNQLALLKVVDNRVYFTVDVQETTNADTINTTFETEVNTVPVGLVMTVTPYIGDAGQVLLNVRPSVSRILGFRNDPNPDLAQAGVQNRVPEIQVREMESLLRVESGQVAVIGGLMQDTIDDSERRVPVLGRLPVIGRLFSYRDDRIDKSELIVFLRPKIVRNASVDGDFEAFAPHLPDASDKGGGGPSTGTGERQD